MRDAKKYCAIFLDDNNRKPVARLFFNGRQKYIGLFDEHKNCTRQPIDNLNEIYPLQRPDPPGSPTTHRKRINTITQTPPALAEDAGANSLHK